MKISRSNFILKSFYKKTNFNFSFKNKLQEHENNQIGIFNEKGLSNAGEMANVARILKKSNPNEGVLENFQDKCIPLIKDADEAQLRKVVDLFLNNHPNNIEFVNEVKKRNNQLGIKPIEIKNQIKLPLTMRFYIWLYHQRYLYVQFFNIFGIKLK
jgi:hypothetical protein